MIECLIMKSTSWSYKPKDWWMKWNSKLLWEMDSIKWWTLKMTISCWKMEIWTHSWCWDTLLFSCKYWVLLLHISVTIIGENICIRLFKACQITLKFQALLSLHDGQDLLENLFRVNHPNLSTLKAVGMHSTKWLLIWLRNQRRREEKMHLQNHTRK